MSTQNTSDKLKVKSDFFDEAIVNVLNNPQHEDYREFVIYLVHPLLQRGSDFTLLKQRMQGRLGALAQESSTICFKPKVWNWMKSYYFPTPMLMEEFLTALWLGPTVSVPHVALLQANAFFRQVVQDVVEYDEELFDVYLRLIHDRFMPCLRLSAHKSEQVIVARAEFIEDPIDMFIDASECSKEVPSSDYHVEDYALSKRTDLWGSLQREDIVPVAQSTYVRTYDMYKHLFFVLPCPTASDQIAQDLSAISVCKEGDSDMKFLSKRKLLEVDSIAVWKRRIPLDVALQACWITASQMRYEGVINNTEPDHSLNELILCMHAYGGAFKDISDDMAKTLFFVRQGWFLSPNGFHEGPTFDPLLFKPAYNLLGCVAVDPEDCCPYVLSTAPSVVIRVPVSWGGSYLFTSRDLCFDTRSVDWTILSPMVICRDRDYITISLHPHYSSCYILCVDLDMSLRGILALPDRYFDYSFDTRCQLEYPEALYKSMMPKFVFPMCEEEQRALSSLSSYEIDNAVNIDIGDYKDVQSLVTRIKCHDGECKTVIVFPFLSLHLDTMMCPDLRFNIRSFNRTNCTARPSYSIYLYALDSGKVATSKHYPAQVGQITESATCGDNRIPRQLSVYNKAATILLPYDDKHMAIASSYLLKHLARCYPEKEVVFSIFLQEMYDHDYPRAQAMMKKVFGDDLKINGVCIHELAYQALRQWSDESESTCDTIEQDDE
jgi:hypothetical protein